MKNYISVINVKKTFRFTGKRKINNIFSLIEKTALDNLTFSVTKGEIFGLLGPNGAGKTTIMRIISTLIKCDSGEVFVSGDSVSDYPLLVRRKIGFLSGDLKLDDYFSPTYLFNFFSSLREVSLKHTNENREILFEQFGIKEFASEKLFALSSGMKQKVSLVISIVHDPQIIIFDEQTNGLDLVSAKTVTDFLIELKKQGKTIILATHIYSLAEKLCDRIGFIINGQMPFIFSPETNNCYTNLEEAFFSVYKQFCYKNKIEVFNKIS